MFAQPKYVCHLAFVAAYLSWVAFEISQLEEAMKSRARKGRVGTLTAARTLAMELPQTQSSSEILAAEVEEEDLRRFGSSRGRSVGRFGNLLADRVCSEGPTSFARTPTGRDQRGNF